MRGRVNLVGEICIRDLGRQMIFSAILDKVILINQYNITNEKFIVLTASR